MRRTKKPRKLSYKALRLVAHTSKRAYERFGLVLSEDEVIEIARMIRGGQSIFMGMYSLTITYHKVKYRGKDMIVVYGKKYKVPITLLREDMKVWK